MRLNLKTTSFAWGKIQILWGLGFMVVVKPTLLFVYTDEEKR